jgi:hypothetical protein
MKTSTGSSSKAHPWTSVSGLNRYVWKNKKALKAVSGLEDFIVKNTLTAL